MQEMVEIVCDGCNASPIGKVNRKGVVACLKRFATKNCDYNLTEMLFRR